MLVGVPLGVASRRGGKSSGFVFTILLVFVYYFLSSTGIALGRQSRLPAFLAVWSANLLFAAAGIFLLWQMASGGRILTAIASLGLALAQAQGAAPGTNGFQLTGLLDRLQPRSQRARPATGPAASFRASSTSTSCASSSGCSCWCWPALCCS